MARAPRQRLLTVLVRLRYAATASPTPLELDMPTVTPREGEEVWETTTEGTVWVSVTDERGREREVRVGGKPGKLLRIKRIDREVNQERIEDVDADPFRNGLLKRKDSGPVDEMSESDQALSTEELMKLFAKSSNSFQSAVDKLNEINVRRMKAMAESLDATQSQVAYLDDVIERKYRKHGDTPTYREMMAIGEITR